MKLISLATGSGAPVWINPAMVQRIWPATEDEKSMANWVRTVVLFDNGDHLYTPILPDHVVSLLREEG